ncbi:MAG: DUF4259 domain-containing protein [Planctomycetia bacterium]|nr:DUF4259 domain-containing protein [Planctomycetia bacterium]
MGAWREAAGNPGYANAYTEKVDLWVAAHPLTPPGELLKRAEAAIDRVLGERSELRELWNDEGAGTWLTSVDDPRRRLRA